MQRLKQCANIDIERNYKVNTLLVENYRINVNYAKALFLLATDQGEVDRTCEDMKFVHRVCDENHVLNVIYSNPVIKEAKKLAITRELFESSVSKLTMAFLNFIVRKHRAVSLRGISGAYIDLYRKTNGIVKAELRTAVDVDSDAKATMEKIIGDYTGKKVEMDTVTDNTMLGGFRVTFDNTMYDARIRTQIAKLLKEFSKNTYEKSI